MTPNKKAHNSNTNISNLRSVASRCKTFFSGLLFWQTNNPSPLAVHPNTAVKTVKASHAGDKSADVKGNNNAVIKAVTAPAAPAKSKKIVTRKEKRIAAATLKALSARQFPGEEFRIDAKHRTRRGGRKRGNAANNSSLPSTNHSAAQHHIKASDAQPHSPKLAASAPLPAAMPVAQLNTAVTANADAPSKVETKYLAASAPLPATKSPELPTATAAAVSTIVPISPALATKRTLKPHPQPIKKDSFVGKLSNDGNNNAKALLTIHKTKKPLKPHPKPTIRLADQNILPNPPQPAARKAAELIRNKHVIRNKVATSDAKSTPSLRRQVSAGVHTNNKRQYISPQPAPNMASVQTYFISSNNVVPPMLAPSTVFHPLPLSVPVVAVSYAAASSSAASALHAGMYGSPLNPYGSPAILTSAYTGGLVTTAAVVNGFNHPGATPNGVIYARVPIQQY